MAKPIQDDLSGVLLDSENDTIYELSVTKKEKGTDGKNQLLKLSFDIGHDSFMSIVAKPFEGKKVLTRWQKYVPPTDAEKAEGRKGRFVRV